MPSKLVGIVNITPDSFSDGGRFNTTDATLSYATQLIEDGANILDIGAESTRPGATPLSAQDEWARLEPVLPALISLAHSHNAEISLDSRHPANIAKALALGIDWINDVSGFEGTQMVSLAQTHANTRIILMHNLGIPADKNTTIPAHKNAIETVLVWGQSCIASLAQAGICKDRIVFDPGIGFGKTAQQSHEIIQQIEAFHALGVALYVGHSRKSFFGLSADASLKERDEATLKISRHLSANKVEYLRVHNITMHQYL